jgi:hypothetical protein
MPLARFEKPIQDAAGNLIPNVWAEVRVEGPGAPLAKLKSDRNGLVNMDNPALFADGVVAFHAEGSPYRIDVWAAGGYAETFRYQAVGTAAERDFGLFVPAGDYDEEESYDLSAIVGYGGAIFISAIPNNLGNLPTISPEPASNDYWMLLPFGGFYTADYIDLPMYAEGEYDSADVLFRYQFTSDTVFPAGLTGSVGSCSVAPSGGAASVPIKKNGSSVGSLNFANGATTGTFTFASAVTFVAGDVISIEAPAVHVTAFAGLTMTLRGVRSASVGVTPIGTTTIDFGAFPGEPMVTKAITGQAAIQADAVPEAWLVASPTADHSADEHRIADIEIRAGEVVAGVGFTVTAIARGSGENAPRMYGLWTIAWRWSA